MSSRLFKQNKVSIVLDSWQKCSKILVPEDVVRVSVAIIEEQPFWHDIKTLEVGFWAVTPKCMQTYNARYRGKNTSTNVLALKCWDDEELSVKGMEHLLIGEVLVCWDVVKAEAIEANKLLRTHAYHMIIHGLLHLVGYDHQDDHQEAAMRSEEEKWLARL